MRAVGLMLAVMILAFSVFTGLRDGLPLLKEAANNLQLVVAVGQIAYAVTALLALLGLWRRQSWTLAATSAWALATIVVGSVASIAWSDPNLMVALLAGLVTAVVVGWVVWFVWYHFRTPPA